MPAPFLLFSCLSADLTPGSKESRSILVSASRKQHPVAIVRNKRRDEVKQIEIEVGGKTGLLFAALTGAALGALAVLLGTKAVPKMMSKMMQNMIANMSAAGCEPAEL